MLLQQVPLSRASSHTHPRPRSRFPAMHTLQTRVSGTEAYSSALAQAAHGAIFPSKARAASSIPFSTSQAPRARPSSPSSATPGMWGLAQPPLLPRFLSRDSRLLSLARTPTMRSWCKGGMGRLEIVVLFKAGMAVAALSLGVAGHLEEEDSAAAGS